jgi:hypothetical protein
LTVTNNVVVTDIYQGMSFSSVHNGLIANNTIIWDGCEGETDPSVCGTTTFLVAGNVTHEGTPTNNLTLRNNIATEMEILAPSSGTTVDHNIVFDKIALTVGTTTSFYQKPGIYGDHNTIASNLNAGFVQFDTTGLHYNMHLNASSPALGIGVPSQAPSVDIEGNPRVSPIAAGAYTSSYPAVAYERSRNSLLASVAEAFGDFWRVLLSFFALL